MKYSLTHHLNATPEGMLGGLPFSETDEIEIEASSWEEALEFAKKLFKKINTSPGSYQFTCSATLWASDGKGLKNRHTFFPNK